MPWKKQDVERTLTRVFWNSECFKACEILQIIRLIVIRTFRDYSCPVTDELIFIPRRDFPRGKWWRVPQQSAVSNQQQQQPELLGYRQHTLTLRAGRGIALEMMSASPVRWSICAYMAGHCRHEKLYFICRRKHSSTGFNQVHNRF